MDYYSGTDERFRAYTDNETFARIRDDGDLCRMWARCAKEYANAPALYYDGSELTYAQLDEKVALLRGALSANGIRRGDFVGVFCPNSADFAVCFLAAVTLGCAALALPPQLDENALAGISCGYGLKAVVCSGKLLPKCALIADIPVMCPEDAAYASNSYVSAAAVDPDDPCAIMFTGGTTGRSKGALLSHAAVMQGVINGCYGIKDIFGQRYLLVLPLSHVFGLIRNLLTSLYTGSALYICKSPQDLFRDAAAFRPTILVLVPALAEMALALSKKLGRNMLGDNMKTVICGAAAVPQYLIEEYEKLGIKLLPGYGLTESANLVSGNPEPLKKPGSVGIPFPNQELRIVDGELELRGRNMLSRYIATDESARDADGWFRTGDLARLDEDGYLYITGRTKEIIVLGNAENVSPALLESRFNALSFVQDSQVFEASDKDGKHFLVLEVVLRPSETPALGSDPKAAALEKLWEVNNRQLPAERVTRIIIRDSDFERSPSMKIIRYKNKTL